MREVIHSTIGRRVGRGRRQQRVDTRRDLLPRQVGRATGQRPVVGVRNRSVGQDGATLLAFCGEPRLEGEAG